MLKKPQGLRTELLENLEDAGEIFSFSVLGLIPVLKQPVGLIPIGFGV